MDSSVSYEKTDVTIPNLSSELATLPIPDANEGSIASLLSSGITVTLDDGSPVWVACVAQDNPETPFVEFVTVSVMGDADGVRTRPSGQPIHVAFMAGVAPNVVATLGVDGVRKDLMLIALGETPIHPDDWAAMTTTDRSIRTAILVAAQVAAAPTDVL